MRRLFAFSISVLILVSVTSFHVYADTSDEASISVKIDQLYSILGNTYFNIGRDGGCGVRYSGANHGCYRDLTSNIVATQWFKGLFGEVSTSQFPEHYYSYSGGSGAFSRNAYSCVGFANFAEWWIFKKSNEDYINTTKVGTFSFNESSMLSNAKAGDIISVDGSHSAIYISCNSDGIVVLDSNWLGTEYFCGVQKHQLDYSYYRTVTISRSTTPFCAFNHTQAGQKLADGSWAFQTVKQSDGSWIAQCKECGTVYQLPALDTSISGVYIMNSGDIEFGSAPYKESTTLCALKGSKWNIIGKAVNAYGDIWYQTDDGRWFCYAYIDSNGKWVYANVKRINDLPKPPVPDKPTNLKMEPLSGSTARVSWVPVQGATSYEIEFSRPGVSWTIDPDYHEGTSYTTTGLQGKYTYQFRVRAINDVGFSEWAIVTYPSATNIDTVTPGKPSLIGMRESYSSEEEVAFVWNSTTNTTHYNIYIDKKVNGTYDRVEEIDHTNSGLKRKLESGEYRVLLRSNNSNSWLPDGSTCRYTDGDYVYFSVHAAVVTLTLDPRGGAVAPTVMAIRVGGTYVGLPTPIREGYTFLGWGANPDSTVFYTDSSIVSNPGDHTLYAVWRQNEAPIPSSQPTTNPQTSIDDGVKVSIDGTQVKWTDAVPFIDSNSRTLVPLRAVGDALGVEVGWDSDNRTAIFTKNSDSGSKTIRFPIDSSIAYTEVTEKGKTTSGTVQMDTAAIILSETNRSYAPVRYLAEFFGFDVGWDNETKTAIVSNTHQNETVVNVSGEPLSQEYWASHVPGPGINVPLEFTVIESSGVQPLDVTLSYSVEIRDGRCFSISRNTTNGGGWGGIIEICYGHVTIQSNSWSDGKPYLCTYCVAGLPEKDNRVNDYAPILYKDYIAYEQMIERFGSFRELFNNHSVSKIRGSCNSSSMIANSDWCFIIGVYDSNGSRVGYTVYQIENTPELLEARAQYIVRANGTTGEFLGTVPAHQR